MSTLTESLKLVTPDPTDNVSVQIFNQNFDTIDAEIKALKTDYIIAQGTQGIWSYRRWDSGLGECWIEAYNVSNISFTSAWSGVNLYTAYIASPGNYPFTFKNAPIVIPTWSSSSTYSCPIWAKPNGSLTQCPQFQLLDPKKGTQSNAVIGVYVKGTWK